MNEFMVVLALEAHVAVAEQDLREIEAIKRHIKEKLKAGFGIEHATLEVESAGRTDHDNAVIREGE
jgi:cobalt-zinc-cadmium efflux system protein